MGVVYLYRPGDGYDLGPLHRGTSSCCVFAHSSILVQHPAPVSLQQAVAGQSWKLDWVGICPWAHRALNPSTNQCSNTCASWVYQNTKIHIQYLETTVCKSPKVLNVIKSYEISQICGLVERTLNTELGGDVPEILTLHLCTGPGPPLVGWACEKGWLQECWCDAGEQIGKVLEK